MADHADPDAGDQRFILDQWSPSILEVVRNFAPPSGLDSCSFGHHLLVECLLPLVGVSSFVAKRPPGTSPFMYDEIDSASNLDNHIESVNILNVPAVWIRWAISACENPSMEVFTEYGLGGPKSKKNVNLFNKWAIRLLAHLSDFAYNKWNIVSKGYFANQVESYLVTSDMWPATRPTKLPLDNDLDLSVTKSSPGAIVLFAALNTLAANGAFVSAEAVFKHFIKYYTLIFDKPYYKSQGYSWNAIVFDMYHKCSFQGFSIESSQDWVASAVQRDQARNFLKGFSLMPAWSSRSWAHAWFRLAFFLNVKDVTRTFAVTWTKLTANIKRSDDKAELARLIVLNDDGSAHIDFDLVVSYFCTLRSDWRWFSTY